MTEKELRDHLATHTTDNSWWISDARGIPLARVCGACEAAVRRRYKPEVLGECGRYEDAVEEPIEEDY